MVWECVTLKATESNQFQWSTAKIHKKKLITHVISSLPTTKLENCIETAVFADKKEGNAFINAFSWCCCWCKPPDLVRKYTCVTWPALRCSIILCQDRVQRSAAFKAAEVCCSRLQHHTLLQQKPGRMFANSRRARAHSHGHAHDCRHGHARGYYHGHKKTHNRHCPWLQSRARLLYFGCAHTSFHTITINPIKIHQKKSF